MQSATQPQAVHARKVLACAPNENSVGAFLFLFLARNPPLLAQGPTDGLF